MQHLRRGLARRAAGAAPRGARRWCGASAGAGAKEADAPRESPLKEYWDQPYQIWNTKNDETEPKELPMAESMSHVLLKVRLATRLLDTCQDEAERAKLTALHDDLMQRTQQWRFHKSRLVPDAKSAEADKAALNVVIRYALRFGQLTQMTYDWIMGDIISVYGVRALDGTFLVQLLARAGLCDADENLVLTANQKSLQAPEWVNQLEFNPAEIEDDCADIREVFKTRSYAIDDPATFEVDDAVAVTEDGWVTVHVADVSRYLPYASDLRVAAQNLATTVYFPDQILTMLPRALVEAATLRSAPDESLTCSVAFKLSDDGDVLERRVFVARTDNCVRITYEQVNAALKNLGVEEYAHAKDVPMPDWYTAEDGAALLRLQRYARTLRTKRIDRGALMIVRPEWYPKLSTEDSDDISHTARTTVSTDAGYATYKIDVKRRENLAFDSRKIVEEFMLLSGNSVAMVCLSENIPCAFRVTPNDVETGEDFAVGVASTRVVPEVVCDSLEGQYERGTQLLNHQKAAFYSSLDIGHVALCATYCHFTSPLRRYPDLLVHYHVKDWLKRRLSKSYAAAFGAEDQDNMTAVLKRALPAVCQRVSNVTNSKKKMMRGMVETWLIRDIERKIREDPARRFEGYVGATHWVAASMEHHGLRQGMAYCSTVVLVDHGLLVRVYHDGVYQEGQRVWCRIEETEAQTRHLRVTLVGAKAAAPSRAKKAAAKAPPQKEKMKKEKKDTGKEAKEKKKEAAAKAKAKKEEEAKKKAAAKKEKKAKVAKEQKQKKKADAKKPSKGKKKA